MFYLKNRTLLLLCAVFVLFASCNIAPDTGFDPDIDDWMTYATTKGAGFTHHDGSDFFSANGVRGNSYTLYVKDPGTDTFTWTSENPSITITPSADTHSAVIKIDKTIEHNIYDTKVTATSTSSAKEATAYFTAGIYKVTARKLLDGVYYKVSFVENFNDTQLLEDNWYMDNEEHIDMDRPYWQKEAVAITNNMVALMVKPSVTPHRVSTNYNNNSTVTYIAGGLFRRDKEQEEQKQDVLGYVEAKIKVQKSATHTDMFRGQHSRPQGDVGNSLQYTYDIWSQNSDDKIKQVYAWPEKETGNIFSPPRINEYIRPTPKDEWMVVGMLWTSTEITYYSGPSSDKMVEKSRINLNGTGSPAHMALTTEEYTKFRALNQSVVGKYPQNWRFHIELGDASNREDGVALQTMLDTALSGNKIDVMYIDYFAYYQSTF